MYLEIRICRQVEVSLRWIFNWCSIPWKNFNLVGGLVHFAATWGNCLKERKILLAILYGFLWCIWKEKNDNIISSYHHSISYYKGCIFPFTTFIFG
uniref:Uncharacterized protein n=1 Tax=Lactuca sativa TaxID=4236 RepID=A0A9R1VHQ1_LACSA|nr:hypothetical protein LSAT_V11C500259380 [Lactuca sativa]